MSVKDTNQGTWQVRWRDANGRQRARTFRTKALAEHHERKMRADQVRAEAERRIANVAVLPPGYDRDAGAR